VWCKFIIVQVNNLHSFHYTTLVMSRSNLKIDFLLAYSLVNSESDLLVRLRHLCVFPVLIQK
jgi:hypothetical protein